MSDELHLQETFEVGIKKRSINWRRVKRTLLKFLNGTILVALITFIILHTQHGPFWKIQKAKMGPTSKRDDSRNFAEEKPTKKVKDVKIKVPWRFHPEDDGFLFPKINTIEKFIAYKPAPVSWPKQLLQFENAVVFAYLLERTLLVPPLIPARSLEQNITTEYDKHFPISQIIDFNLLSRVASLKELTIKDIEKLHASANVYNICHDRRLGFWVDFIPAVEDIQIWRLLKSQRFTAFPVRLDDHEVDLMCPGTIQYGNRWGPPMKVKPIIRSILTELYERDEDLLFFEGDTLCTKDMRFFDKKRTKTIQEILIFHVQFSKRINRLLAKLMRHLGHRYNAILSGPLSKNGSLDRTELQMRLQVNAFFNRSKTIFISCMRKDENEFKFLKKLGYDLIFESQLDIQTHKNNTLLQSIHKLCLALLCAYASKLIAIDAPENEFFVEHLRLQNVTMKDGLVADNINVRWAKHTQLPRKDERVILDRKNLTSFKISNNHNKTMPVENKIPNAVRVNLTEKMTTASYKNNNLMANETQLGQTTRRAAKSKFPPKSSGQPKKTRTKVDLMVCSFCLYMKRITAEHGCPSLSSWCH